MNSAFVDYRTISKCLFTVLLFTEVYLLIPEYILSLA
jgi:hypothetical protein